MDHAIDDVGLVDDLRQDSAAAVTEPLDQEGSAGGAIGQYLGRTGVDDLPLVEHQHRGAPFGLVQVGGAPHDADARVDQIVDHFPQFAARDGVDADARLVEQQHLRRMEQRAGQSQLLLHAARELAGQPTGKGCQRRERQEAVKGLASLGADHATQIGVEIEVLEHREIFVKAKSLRHVTEHTPHRRDFADGIVTFDENAPLAGHEQPGHQPQERGLAGAVRADQPGDLSRLDAQVELVDCWWAVVR